MNEDILWVFKVFFVLFCLWYIGGGINKLEQKILAKQIMPKNTTNTGAVYQPKVYNQTIILK